MVAGVPLIEWLGALLALTYLGLAMREHYGCWYAALVSSALYAKVFFDARLYTEAGLQLIFMVVAVDGVRKWRVPARGAGGLKISRMSPAEHRRRLEITIICSGVLGTVVAMTTDSDVPYLDAAITAFSVLGTILTAEKRIENWSYWIGIDAVSTVVYSYKGLYPTALLYLIYTVLAAKGLHLWRVAERSGAAGEITSNSG
jgi:nicotinamide mononucleotide transporter